MLCGDFKKSKKNMAKNYRTCYYTLAASVQILCHRERSVAICWQGDCCAVYSTRLAMTRTASKNCDKCKKIVMARGVRQVFSRVRRNLQQVVIANVVWRSVGKEIATPCILHVSQ